MQVSAHTLWRRDKSYVSAGDRSTVSWSSQIIRERLEMMMMMMMMMMMIIIIIIITVREQHTRKA